MRKSVALVIVVGGLALGIAGGYALAIAEAASNLPFIGKRDSEGFDRVIEDFAKVGGYESVAANCSGTSDTRRAVGMETQAIHDLEEHKAADANVLNVAEAKLLARAIGNAEKDTHSGAETNTRQRVESLLKNAGWTNPSAAHMREIIQELDRDQCRQVVLGGER